MRTRSILGIFFGFVLGTEAAVAQVATSPSYALSGEEFVAAAGGGSSPSIIVQGRVAYGALGIVAPGASASATRQASSTFVHLFDPLGGSGPLLFGLSTAQGPTGGGTPVAIQGARFQGAATAQFGPTTVPTLQASSTRLFTAAPASSLPIPAGPVALTVTDGGGSTAVQGGFLYVPTVRASDDVVPGSDVLVRYFGPAGNGFGYALALGSVPPTVFPGISGFLQVNVFTLVFLRSSPYLPDGTRAFQYPTPPASTLSGATVYWQSIDFPPVVPEFSNLVSTTFL